MNESSRYTLAVQVDSEPGVLSRVSRLFAGKGYTIQSLAMGATLDPAVARMTIEVIADEKQIRLICNQLRKLICVHSVKIISPELAIRAELSLIKVSAPTSDAHREIKAIADSVGSLILSDSEGTVTLSVVGDEDELQSVQTKLARFGILELVRTGTIAIESGAHILDEQTKVKGEFDYGKVTIQNI